MVKIRIAIRKARHFLEQDMVVYANDKSLKRGVGVQDKFECVECHGRLLLRSGQVRQQHFCHFKSDSLCSGHPTGESEQHKTCKQLLADAINSCKERPLSIFISVPDDLTMRRNLLLDHHFSAKQEYRIPGYSSRADVAVFYDGRLVFIIEVCCTSRTREGTRPEPWIECTGDDILDAHDDPASDQGASMTVLSLIDRRPVPASTQRDGIGWMLRRMVLDLGSVEHTKLLDDQQAWFIKWQRAAACFVKTRKGRWFMKWGKHCAALYRELVRIERDHHTKPLYTQHTHENYLAAHQKSTNGALWAVFVERFYSVYLSTWKIATHELLPRWRQKHQRRCVAHCAWLYRELERLRTTRPFLLCIGSYLSQVAKRGHVRLAHQIFEQRFREVYLNERIRAAAIIQRLWRRRSLKVMARRCAKLFREIRKIERRVFVNAFSANYLDTVLEYTNRDCYSIFRQRFSPIYASKRAMTIFKSGSLRFRLSGYVVSIRGMKAKWLSQERLWLVPIPHYRSESWRYKMRNVICNGNMELFNGSRKEILNDDIIPHLTRTLCD
jgi:hypothetical protein